MYLFSAVLLLCSSFLALLLAWLWLSHSAYTKKKGLPPGGMGFPLLGETLEFLASKPSLASQPFIEKHSSRYGDVFKSHLFGQSFVISTNAEVNDFVLQNEGVLFQSCQPTTAHNRILGKQTLAETHGNMHKMIRDILNDIFSSEKLQGDIIEFVQIIMLRRLPAWQDQFVHVQHEATNWVLSLLLERLMSQCPEDLELQQLQSLYTDTKNMLAFPFNIPGSGYSKRAESLKTLTNILKDKIDRRRISGPLEHGDFLDALLMEEKTGSFPEKSSLILDCIMGILFHGEESTAMALTLMIKFLSESPCVLEHVKEEHAAVQRRKGNAGMLTWEDYQSLKFTRSVINESLRLANVVPWVCRVAMQDIEIKGFLVPKGWRVLLFLMGANVSTASYDDPKSFDPFRWQDNANDSSFTPFGAGLRGCPGAEAARITLAVFLHLLVTRYSWQVVEDDALICFPVMNFQEGFPIVVKNVMDADECLILH